MSPATLNEIRWPLAPLMAAAGHPTVAILAHRLDVAPRTIFRWRNKGLTDHQADRAAIALDYHPSNIWSDWHNP